MLLFHHHRFFQLCYCSYHRIDHHCYRWRHSRFDDRSRLYYSCRKRTKNLCRGIIYFGIVCSLPKSFVHREYHDPAWIGCCCQLTPFLLIFVPLFIFLYQSIVIAEEDFLQQNSVWLTANTKAILTDGFRKQMDWWQPCARWILIGSVFYRRIQFNLYLDDRCRAVDYEKLLSAGRKR